MANPNHYSDIENMDKEVVASIGDVELARSNEAIVLTEYSYGNSLDPVIYFPPESLAGDHFVKTEHNTQCAIKGEASYYTAIVGGDEYENVAWAYENPSDAYKQIKGYVAFYADRVEVK